MNRPRAILAALVMMVVVFWTICDSTAQTSVTTTKYSGVNTGQVMGSGVLRWRLATLTADTDSSMTATALVNIWNNDNLEVPSRVFISMYVDSAAGGGAGNRLHLRVYNHYFSTETPASGTQRWMYKGASLAPIDTLNCAVGASTSASAHAMFYDYVASSASLSWGYVPPYISIKVDKEGVKEFTAGYLDIYWKAVR